MTTTNAQFLTWDRSQPTLLHDMGALVRHAQAHPIDRPRRPVWRLNYLTEYVAEMFLEREDTRWWRLVWPNGRVFCTHPADPLNDPRALAVVTYMEEHMATFGKQPVEQVRVLHDQWDAARFRAEGIDPLGLYAPFGYTPPEQTTFCWRFWYCPEMMADQSRHLSDLFFDQYLDYVAIRLQLRMTNPDVSPEEMEKIIDNSFFHLGPHVSSVMTELQMRALDPTK